MRIPNYKVFPPPSFVQVAIDRPDGGVTIMSIVISDGASVLIADTDANLQNEINKTYPGCAWRRISASDIPGDRTYRNAWKSAAGKIIHDMPKAIEIKKEHLRQERAPLLADLDATYLQADEAGNKVLKAKIAARKQVLRDITINPLITSATTIDQLKSVTAAKVLSDFINTQG